MCYFTALTWLLVPLMIRTFNYPGISIAFFIMSLSFVLVVREAKKIIDFSLSHILKDVVIATFFMTAAILSMRILLVNILHRDTLFLMCAVVGGGALYIAVLYKIKGKELYTEVLELFRSKDI